MCNTAIGAVSRLARNQLVNLEFSSDNFTLGTPDNKACGLYEQTENYGSPAPNIAHFPRFERMGDAQENHPEFGDLRCEWDATIQFTPNPADQTTAPGRWNSERRQ